MLSKKTMISVFFLLIGAAFLTIQLWPYITSANQSKSSASPEDLNRERQRLDIIANDDSARYTTPSSDEEIDSLWLEQMRPIVLELASNEIASTVLASDSPNTFADAAWLALEPMLTGDFESYIDSLPALGGTPPQTDKALEDAQNAFRTKTAILRHVPFDINNTEIRRFATRGKPETIQSLLIPLTSQGIRGMNTSRAPNTFPTTSNYTSRQLDAWEMLVPIQITTDIGNRGPGFYSVILAWDPAEHLWTPIEYRLYYSVHPNEGVIQELVDQRNSG